MQIHFEKNGCRYQSDLNQGISIAILLDFDGAQPSHFGAPSAQRTPMRSGGFVGDVSQGGSCNVDVVSLNPHCNGTHSETVGHIVPDRVSIGKTALEPLLFSALLSVTPRLASRTSDQYEPVLEPDDQVIDREMLESRLTSQVGDLSIDALVLRTLPNSIEKKKMQYGNNGFPPFLTNQAIEWINEIGVRHLLVDMPSVDRTHDQGRLSNHHLYWNAFRNSVEPDQTELEKTITELVFVPDIVEDGIYLLNLQIPAFGNDAAPSRPILFPCSESKT